MTLSNATRDRVKRSLEPLALALGRVGLSPDALTLIGFGVTVAGAVLLALGWWLAGGLVVFLGGTFDLFDGTLARATGRVTPLGGFMDSVFDKAGEVLVYAAIVVATSGAPWSFTFPGSSSAGPRVLPSIAALAMGAAIMVSYVRAKSEGLAFTTGSGMAEVGLMPRELRLVVLSAGLVVTGLTGGVCTSAACPGSSGDGSGWLAAALAIIAVLAAITVVQRILVVRRQAASSATHAGIAPSGRRGP